MRVEVREATESDHATVAGWWVSFFAHLRKHGGDPLFEGAELDEAGALDQLRERLGAGSFVTIATIDGRDAGYLIGKTMAPHVRESPVKLVGHVSQCWVEPWARQRGVARALVADAEARFRAQGIGWIQLSHQAGNLGAAQSWRALGFQPFLIQRGRPIPSLKDQADP